MSLGGCRLLSCLEQHSLERGARLCDGKQPPGLGAGPGPGLLSVCVYLTPCHWSRGARPPPNKKDPPALPQVLSPGVSWLRPHGQHGAPGLLTRCPSLPSSQPSTAPNTPGSGSRGLAVLCPGSHAGSCPPEPQASGTAEPDDVRVLSHP